LNWQTITGEIQGAKDVNSNTLPERVYRLFSYIPSYEEFGTLRWKEGQPAKSYASLEDIHGEIHVYTGGAGQMSEIPVAAFDPVFWSATPPSTFVAL
jgi:tyrosinase